MLIIIIMLNFLHPGNEVPGFKKNNNNNNIAVTFPPLPQPAKAGTQFIDPKCNAELI